nr:hypothetical protein [Tanacetum cinerariifolium]
MRNKINLHTARDDSLLGTLKYVSKTEEHQVYGDLIPKEMLNEYIRNSTAYKTYYAYASGAKEPKKARKFKKPASPKLKIVPLLPKEPNKKLGKAKKYATLTKKTATKPKPTKKKTPVKADRGKGLNVHSEVALSEAAQLKEVTKQSKKDFNISHASGSGDGTDFELEVLDEQQGKISSTDEETDTKPRVPDSNKEHEEDDEEYVNEFTDKEDDADNANEENEEKLDDAKELYKDVNVNLRKEDVEMTNVDQSEADQHNVSQESSSSVLFDFKKKLLNFENVSPTDNEIASLMDTTIRHEELSCQTSTLYIVPVMVIPEITYAFNETIPPPPLSFNPLLRQATPTPRPTDLEVTTLFPALLDFASVFRFN